MIANDYRTLKTKNVTEIKIDGDSVVFERPIYNTITGNMLQLRSDVIYTQELEVRRAALVEEIKDIDAFLADVSTALSQKAADLVEVKETP